MAEPINSKAKSERTENDYIKAEQWLKFVRYKAKCLTRDK